MAKRKSSVEKLPTALKNKVNELYKSGEFTLDEILAKLNELITIDGKNASLPSRSALHRYTKKLDKIGEKLLKRREIAKALVDKIGSEPDSAVARLNIEMMHSVLSDIQIQAESGEVVLDAEEAYYLSRSLEALAKAEKISVDTIIQVKKEALKEASKVAEIAAKEAGLTAKAANEIRAKILGIKVK